MQKVDFYRYFFIIRIGEIISSFIYINPKKCSHKEYALKKFERILFLGHPSDQSTLISAFASADGERRLRRANRAKARTTRRSRKPKVITQRARAKKRDRTFPAIWCSKGSSSVMKTLFHAFSVPASTVKGTRTKLLHQKKFSFNCSKNPSLWVRFDLAQVHGCRSLPIVFRIVLSC